MFLIYGRGIRGLFHHLPWTLRVLSEVTGYRMGAGKQSGTLGLSERVFDTPLGSGQPAVIQGWHSSGVRKLFPQWD